MSTLLQQAIELAKTNPILPRGKTSISRFACILTNKRQTFFGFNQYRSHPTQARFNPVPEAVFIHAEIDAIVQAINWNARRSGTRYGRQESCDLSDYKLAVARVLKDGTPACSKPCCGCQEALIHFHISKIEYVF